MSGTRAVESDHFYFKESECRAMGGSRAVESDLEDSSDDDLYGDESSEDDDDEGEGVRRNNHRLEWDNDL